MPGPLALLHRFRAVGTLPSGLRQSFEAEGILHVAERVGVRQRFSGSVPGVHAGLSVTRHRGLVVFTRSRLHALIPTLTRLEEDAIDQPWTAADSGAARVTIDASGVVLKIDLRRVDKRFSGDLTTTWKTAPSDEVLAALPTRTLVFDVFPEYVFCSLGVRVRQ